jgi:hypothetical protein
MVRLWLIGAGLPVVAVVGNALVRSWLRLHQSACADLILVLLVFDLTILIEAAELEKAIPEVRLIYGFVTLTCAILYAGAIGKVEPDLRRWMSSRPRRGFPFRLMFMSLAVSAVALVTNLAPLAWSLR